VDCEAGVDRTAIARRPFVVLCKVTVVEAVQATDRVTAVDELVVGSKAAKALPLKHLLIVRWLQRGSVTAQVRN
jgi:hypothetical protein